MSIQFTEASLKEKLDSLGEITKEQRASVCCALIGHSKIVSSSFGYLYCGRCDAQIGDTLLGVDLGTKSNGQAIIECDCGYCRDNYAAMGWQDKFEVPNPFDKAAKA